MKKLFCLLIAFALLLPAAFAAAEENPAELNTPDDAPGFYFGADPDAAFKAFEHFYKSDYSYSKEATQENITAGDGTSFLVLTYVAAPANEYTIPMTAKFYYRQGALFAVFMEFTPPEVANFEESINRFGSFIKGAGKDTLKMEEAGISAELLGEAAHLQEGQEIWRYTLTAGETKTNVILSMNAADGKVYLAAFPAGKNEQVTGKTTIELSLADLEGFAELDSEKKEAVRLYAQFIMKQQKKVFEEYIAYLKDQK